MKKYCILVIFILVISLFVGCEDIIDINPSGAWYLTNLVDYSSGEELEFDSEVLLLSGNGTGIEMHLSAEYSEELSYITWKIDTDGVDDYIKIKHSDEYIYDLKFIEMIGSQLICSFFFEDDSNQLYLATYSKLDEDVFNYIGSWSYSEYIQDGEYYDTNDNYFYFYPNGIMEQVLYEFDEPYTYTGTWSILGQKLLFDFDDLDKMEYDTEVSNNILKIFDITDDGADITYVYKRYYGHITNAPPATYPQSTLNENGSFFTNIFSRIADSFK